MATRYVLARGGPGPRICLRLAPDKGFTLRRSGSAWARWSGVPRYFKQTMSLHRGQINEHAVHGRAAVRRSSRVRLIWDLPRRDSRPRPALTPSRTSGVAYDSQPDIKTWSGAQQRESLDDRQCLPCNERWRESGSTPPDRIVAGQRRDRSGGGGNRTCPNRLETSGSVGLQRKVPAGAVNLLDS